MAEICRVVSLNLKRDGRWRLGIVPGALGHCVKEEERLVLDDSCALKSQPVAGYAAGVQLGNPGSAAQPTR